MISPEGGPPGGFAVMAVCRASAAETLDAALGGASACRIIEVPADQHEEAVAEMRRRILAGGIADATGHPVADPDMAPRLVRRGLVTYRQAVNAARHGGIASLSHDAGSGRVECAHFAGISFATEYASHIWNGESPEAALSRAVYEILTDDETNAAAGIAESQVRGGESGGRFRIVRLGARALSKTNAGRRAVRAAIGMLGERVGAVRALAPANAVSRSLRGTFVTAAAVAVVSSIPDLWRAAVRGSVSWAQFARNLCVNVVAAAGGAGGWFWGVDAGEALGAALPLLGAETGGVLVGIAGTLGLGALASKGAKLAGDRIRPDDSRLMLDILRRKTEEAANDHMLSPAEIGMCSARLRKIVCAKWLRTMHAAGRDDAGRARFAGEALAAICGEIVAARTPVALPGREEVEAAFRRERAALGRGDPPEFEVIRRALLDRLEKAVLESFQALRGGGRDVFLKGAGEGIPADRLDAAEDIAGEDGRDGILLLAGPSGAARGGGRLIVTRGRILWGTPASGFQEMEIMELESAEFASGPFGCALDLVDAHGSRHRMPSAASGRRRMALLAGGFAGLAARVAELREGRAQPA